MKKTVITWSTITCYCQFPRKNIYHTLNLQYTIYILLTQWNFMCIWIMRLHCVVVKWSMAFENTAKLEIQLKLKSCKILLGQFSTSHHTHISTGGDGQMTTFTANHQPQYTNFMKYCEISVADRIRLGRWFLWKFAESAVEDCHALCKISEGIITKEMSDGQMGFWVQSNIVFKAIDHILSPCWTCSMFLQESMLVI